MLKNRLLPAFGRRDLHRQAMAERAIAMLQLLQTSNALGRQPWVHMYDEGHGAHWGTVARYTEHHYDLWNQALNLDR